MEGLFPALCKFLGLPEVPSSDKDSSVTPPINNTCTDTNNSETDAGDQSFNTHVSSDTNLEISSDTRSEKPPQNSSDMISQQTQKSNIDSVLQDTAGRDSSSKQRNNNSENNVTDVVETDSIIKVEESLGTSVPPLCGESLSVPAASQAYLKVEFSSEKAEVGCAILAITIFLNKLISWTH